MHYCLNKEELIQLMEYKYNNKLIQDEPLKTMVNNAESWQDELCCVNYIFSKILERMVKDGKEGNSLINLLYGIEDDMFFHVQEIDYNYIGFMLKNIRNNSVSLEEELIMLQNKIGEHQYGITLRY